jgi:hypothetical protein
MAGGGAFVRGVVTRHLSPYEQKLFVGFVKNAFTKVSGKVSRNFFDVVPAVGLGFATYYWTNSKYEEYQHSHRS